MRNYKDSLILFESTKLLEAAFTAASTDIVTCAAHGFNTGDKIRVTTSGVDLPSGLAIDTDYYIEKIDVDTFYLHTNPDMVSGTLVDIVDAGTGTHTLHLKSKYAYVKDFRHLGLSWHTADSANFTIKIKMSRQEDVDFEAAASATNRWNYVQNIDNENGETIDGDTGISLLVAGTDENLEFVINLDNVIWIAAEVTAWVAGAIDLRVSEAS